MPKKQDNNTQIRGNHKDKSRDRHQQYKKVEGAKSPQKKEQNELKIEMLNLMTPFPYPPKNNQRQTATSYGQNVFGHDMKVIQTPYNIRQPFYIIPGMQYIHDDSRPFSNKIQWDTPMKSDPQNSQGEYDSESRQNSSVIPQEYSEKQECSEQQPEQQSNPQEYQQKEKEKDSHSLDPLQKPVSRRLSYSKKSSQIHAIPEPNLLSKKVFCNCKKTKCLKLYCDCFRINQTCDGCNCFGCHNLEQYADQRNNSILVLMDRNPDPFSQKIEADKHLKGCNCKKSFCLKKYCQCFQAGLKCGGNCKCGQCKNGGGSQMREKQRGGSQMRDLNRAN